MPRLVVRKHNEETSTVEFDSHFNIVVNENQIWWNCGNDSDNWLSDHADVNKPSLLGNGATLMVWLAGIGTSGLEQSPEPRLHEMLGIGGYTFRLVRWEWDIYVDGRLCKPGLYDYIAVFWNEVRLSYRHYEFVLLFDKFEITEGDKNTLPEPVVKRDNVDPSLFFL